MQSIKMNKHLENQWKSIGIKENQSKYIKTMSKTLNIREIHETHEKTN